MSVPTTPLDVNRPSTMATVRTRPLAAVSSLETFIIRTYIYRLVTDGRLDPPLTFLASFHYGD